MVRRALAANLDEAAEMIGDGLVLVGGAPANTPKRLTSDAEAVTVVSPHAFVGRGGNKLDGALDDLGVSANGRRVVDVGSSTGGFTDCVLQRGATAVAAVDVGTHQLSERLRGDDRVTVLEKTDVRSLQPTDLGGACPLITVDVSFISLGAIMASLVGLLAYSGDLVVLVKPQFEVSRADASRGRGVIREPRLWGEALASVTDGSAAHGLVVTGATVSPVRGTKGNTEFFLRLNHEDGLPSGLDPLGPNWAEELIGSIGENSDG